MTAGLPGRFGGGLRSLVPFDIAPYDVSGSSTTVAYLLERVLPIPADEQQDTIARLREELAQVRAERDRLKLAEEALRESEDRFRAMADNIPQLAWMADEKGWIFWYNKRWYDYTGTTLEEMQGWGWKKVNHPEHVARVVERIQVSWETGQPWEDTFPLRGKDGTYRWFLSRALPIRDASGRLVCWFGTNTDVSEQRAANARLAEQAETLQRQKAELAALSETALARSEATLAARNAELQAQAEALQRQKEQLQTADRYKDEFLGVISHELRTPLNFIMGFASVLKDEVIGPLVPKQAEAVGKILLGADRMLGIVDDLLDFARIQAGRFDMHRRPTAFAPLVLEVTAAAQPMAHAKGIEIATELPELPPASLDSARIVQLLNNLVGNASKFTPRGGHIRVSARLDGDAIVCEVADDGIGIAPADRDRLFTRFQQLDMGATRRAGGTGLGLAISKAIAEAHGGTIGVRSDGEGQGSTFWFRLPL